MAGLLAKTGLDTLKVGGHKIPIGLIGAGAAVVAVLLVIRARNQGSTVSAGSAPGANSGVNPVVDFSGAATADSASLANLSQQVMGLQQSLTAAPPTPVSYQVASSNPDWRPGAGWGGAPGLLPLYGQASGIQWVPASTQLEVTGPIGPGGLPVDYLGRGYLIAPEEWQIAQQSSHPATFRPLGT